MKKPEEKVLEKMKRRQWYFDDEKQSLIDLRLAFKNSHRNSLVNSVRVLLAKDWNLNSIEDLMFLDEMRKIFRQHEMRKFKKRS